MTAASTEFAEAAKVVSSRALPNGATIEIRKTQRARGIKAEFQAVWAAQGGATVPLTPPIATDVAASLRDAFVDALRVERFPLERQPLEYLSAAYERTFDSASPTDAAVAAILRGLGRAIDTSNHELIGKLARICIDAAEENCDAARVTAKNFATQAEGLDTAYRDWHDARGAAEDVVRQSGRRNFAAARLLLLAAATLRPEATRSAKARWPAELERPAQLRTTHGQFPWLPPDATHHVLLAEPLIDYIAEIMPSRLPTPVHSRRKATMSLAVTLRDKPPTSNRRLAIAALKAVGFDAKEAAAFAASGRPAKKRAPKTGRT